MPFPLSNSIRSGPNFACRILPFVIGFLASLIAGCDGQTGSGSQRSGAVSATPSDAHRLAEQEYERQMDVAKRHQEETERQLQETARQLAESDRQQREMAAQSKRYDDLLNRWISQSDRADALLSRWEKLTTTMEQRVQETP